MDIILCHTTADFDALGAAVGLTRLLPGSLIVLSGGCHPAVRDFLALHRDEYALIERRAVNPEQIRTLAVVDTQRRDRLGKAAEWLDLPQVVEIIVYDHHLDSQMDIPATQTQISPVGATTTLIVEELQARLLKLTPSEATVMALGIHVDTGSLTFDQTTARDAMALAWLMQQGASLRLIAEYLDPGLSAQLQELLTSALKNLQSETLQGYTVSWVLLKTSAYVPGLSSLASLLMELTESDALLLGARYPVGETGDERLTVIGRSQIHCTNLNELFQPLGGGGHSQAASVTLRGVDPPATLKQLLSLLLAQIPQPPTARDLMSSPVRTIRPETTIGEAQRILLRYGHSGLCVVEAIGQLVGIISRRDIDIALHHGFSHAPVKGYMSTNLKTITPDTTLPEIQALMVTYDIGRLPVLKTGLREQGEQGELREQGSQLRAGVPPVEQTGVELIGIVTRTDVIRELHQGSRGAGESSPLPLTVSRGHLLTYLRDRLAPPFWELLTKAALQAEQRGWHLYLVGGAVRDLLLANLQETEERGVRSEENSFYSSPPAPPAPEAPPASLTPRPLLLTDIDLVVDGFHQSEEGVGAGVELARALGQLYPDARLEIHGAFQTAALLWHKDQALGSLWVDIATARTEFYPYPAANPEVEASSIRQDLYRRDFTINALAVRLTSPRAGGRPQESGGRPQESGGRPQESGGRPQESGGRPQESPLLDFFGGLLDLLALQIRVLHPNSFIEDPTRIYRAVRFAVRLGFEIEPTTEGYIRYAIASGIYYQTSVAENTKARPALQTRLKSELKYILQEPYWKAALRLLASLDALRCIHPTLELDKSLWRQLRLEERCLRRLDSKHSLTHWLLRLEVIIAHLAPSDRGKVAENLQLPDDSIKRLLNLAQVQVEVMESLPLCQVPSQVVQLLRRYNLPTLILIAVQSPRSIRRLVWRYVTCWANVQPPLNGDDLKALGYKPGPHYRQILEQLLAATLDGVISDRAEAETFLSAHYPR